ncbi:hypothetical protein [Sinobaca sp. H24]|uniref:hypothetical protein n=1 Tax=Sinobaca sp. H24 TaxID=2923376 RepID=UPI00207AF640|nr:hypothetical protein [Sinobaca sp. H24]
MDKRHTVILESSQWSWMEIDPDVPNVNDTGELSSSIENWWNRAQQVATNNIEIIYNQEMNEPVINGMLHDVSAADADQLFFSRFEKKSW